MKIMELKFVSFFLLLLAVTVNCAPTSDEEEANDEWQKMLWQKQGNTDINWCPGEADCELECKLFGFRKRGDCSICECIRWSDQVPDTSDCDEGLIGTKDSGYRGCQTLTRSGRTCQAWNSQVPQKHSRTAANYPDANLTENYCRNPDGEGDTIWCYTEDVEKRWEYCDPMDNPELYEGDIVLKPSTKHWLQMKTEEGLEELANEPIDENVALGAAGNVPLWTNRKTRTGRYVVPYTVAYSLSSNRNAMYAIQQAAADFKAYTCIDLVPRTGSQSPYIEYFLGGGCYSPVGQVNQRQQVSLGNGCHYKGTAIHETLHSLGFWHEQSRSDRDNHVIINWGNIQRGTSYNFNKMSAGELRNLNSNYDTQSVMHYGSYAFSSNGQPTITDRARRPISTQRNGFSKIDLEEMNRLYPCSGTGTGVTTPTTGGACKDDNAQCASWAAQYCTDPTYQEWMSTNCKLSCRKCTVTPKPTTTPTGCSDSNQNCASWAENGECKKNPDYMLVNCCKSCDAGTKVTTTTTTTTKATTTSSCTDSNNNCASWAENGECKKNPDYMLVNCCKSCKGGTSNCADKDTQCPTWKDQYCEDPSYVDWMAENCAKTCGKCGGVTVVKDPCTPNPCENGGTCRSSGKTFTCTCATGYRGETCAIRVCKDGDTNCPSWAQLGYCTHPSYKSWMQKNCKKSCKVQIC